MGSTPVPAVIIPSRRHEFTAGMRAILPLLVGGIPFGIIFGAVAVTGGLSPAAAAAMSALVFAGSAQFVAAGLVAGGAGAWVIIGATFVVNLRHVLYGVSLAPFMRHLPQRWLIVLGFLLTDESFVIVDQRYKKPDPSPYKHWFHLGTAVAMYFNWQICTFLGIWAGQSIPNPRAWGLDFALPVTFIGMLIPMLTGRALFTCSLTAGLAALLWNNLPHQLGLIIAVLLGVAAGILVEAGSGGQAAPLPQHHAPAFDSEQNSREAPASHTDTPCSPEHLK